ncbi:MAG: proline--tRNA ligase [Chitinophagales bacterium]|nr:proline--tRNA ligase [Sphingobacteriales bacterium]MBP6664221.1 proline--tRNA ligase [Chitinophagales bacterium]MBP7533311.1 proline--tRNA ligase [Chitinophagales bacterium]
MSKVITPRNEDYSKWYLDVATEAGLAENSPVRGCMIIKPYGFAIWENMRDTLDARFKATGHVNASFPLLIPKSFLSKEADHIEGFAKECAVVTHYRLKKDPNGKGVIVDPEAKLEEELIIRPTSETIIWNTYRNWIRSYRDLPILINQWANVMRWEMRTRLFLRTAEFHWQEGHTAHATAAEAVTETVLMLNEYANFMENHMAIPVIKGVKTPNERFAGAVDTYCVEALMQDGKALQMGTSHFLGQNFAKAFDVKFTTKEGTEEYAWATSWGSSTRMIGGLIMTHSDDEGLILPPKLAPIQVVIVPIINKNTKERLPEIEQIVANLKAALPNARIKYDDDDNRTSGFKFAEYELKGVPLRIAIGARDLDNNTCELSRRDTREKQICTIDSLPQIIAQLLIDIQQNLFDRALAYRTAHTTRVDTWDEFVKTLNEKTGFVYAHWDGTSETEDAIKEATNATIRCIPLDNPLEDGTCIFSGKPSTQRVLFARSY